MKCQNCGETYKKEDIYCGNCGTKIKKENKFINFILKHKIKIIIISIIIASLMSLYAIVSYFTSPVYIANKYFNAVINNDYDKIYTTFNVENEFVTKEQLKEKIKELKVDNFKIVDYEITDDQALITYEYTKDNQKYYANVSLTKDGSKYLIFNNWKINSGKLSKDITIKLPKGSKVTLDNKELTKYLKEDENYDIYEIPYMITGTYNLDVTLTDGTNINEDIVISSNETYSLNNIDLVDNTKNIVKEQAKNYISELYNGLINNNESVSDSINNLYKEIKYYYKNSDIKLKSFNITSLDIIKATYNKKGNLSVTYKVEYDYTLVNGDNTYSGSNRDIIEIEYNYVDGYNLKSIKNTINFPFRKGV